MAKGPASARINIPRLRVNRLASRRVAMDAGQCVISIIGCLSNCADLVESFQAEQGPSSKTSSWKFWKKRETPLGSTLFAEKTKALCDSIVDNANQLGQALEHRCQADENSFDGNFPGM